MKIFFDTEFTGLHQGATLISIGLVAADGRTFYAELTDYDHSQVDEWIEKNVIDNLILGGLKAGVEMWSERVSNAVTIVGNSAAVAQLLQSWLSEFDNIEMWSDVYAWDWVLFCQLWGGPFHIPENVYYIPFDLATLFEIKGIDPDINREGFAGIADLSDKHNALHDAQVIKGCYEKAIVYG